MCTQHSLLIYTNMHNVNAILHIYTHDAYTTYIPYCIPVYVCMTLTSYSPDLVAGGKWKHKYHGRGNSSAMKASREGFLEEEASEQNLRVSRGVSQEGKNSQSNLPAVG